MSVYDFSIQDVFNFAAIKSGVAGWVGYNWKAAGRDSIVDGCVPGGLFTRGPRKGKPNFQHKDTKDKSTIVVTEQELQADAVKYESETGKCWNCKGTCEVWSGWSAKEGTRTRTCKKCAGTGLVAEVAK